MIAYVFLPGILPNSENGKKSGKIKCKKEKSARLDELRAFGAPSPEAVENTGLPAVNAAARKRQKVNTFARNSKSGSLARGSWV
jgi:hypothetical protein